TLKSKYSSRYNSSTFSTVFNGTGFGLGFPRLGSYSPSYPSSSYRCLIRLICLAPDYFRGLPPRYPSRYRSQYDLLYFHCPLHCGFRVVLQVSPPEVFTLRLVKRTFHLLFRADISCATDICATDPVRSKLKCPLFVANEMSAFALRAASLVTERAVQRSRRICECLSTDPIR